jgi:hypothetical protein
MIGKRHKVTPKDYGVNFDVSVSQSKPVASTPKGNSIDSSSIANTALGVVSLIKGLRNKKPKSFNPTRYTANIRPAQGNEESVKRIKNDIAEQVSSGSRDVTRMAGSDVNTGILARLGIQNNATKAIASAEAENAKLYQQDQNRVSQEMNQAELINTQIRNEADQYNSLVAQSNYAANQAAAAQGVQNSLQYAIDRGADRDNKRVAENQINQRLDVMNNTHRLSAYNDNFLKTGDATKAEIHSDAVMKNRDFSIYKTYNFQSRPWWQGIFGKKKSSSFTPNK